MSRKQLWHLQTFWKIILRQGLIPFTQTMVVSSWSSDNSFSLEESLILPHRLIHRSITESPSVNTDTSLRQGWLSSQKPRFLRNIGLLRLQLQYTSSTECLRLFSPWNHPSRSCLKNPQITWSSERSAVLVILGSSHIRNTSFRHDRFGVSSSGTPQLKVPTSAMYNARLYVSRHVQFDETSFPFASESRILKSTSAPETTTASAAPQTTPLILVSPPQPPPSIPHHALSS